jgi:hypothetical protein
MSLFPTYRPVKVAELITTSAKQNLKTPEQEKIQE